MGFLHLIDVVACQNAELVKVRKELDDLKRAHASSTRRLHNECRALDEELGEVTDKVTALRRDIVLKADGHLMNRLLLSKANASDVLSLMNSRIEAQIDT